MILKDIPKPISRTKIDYKGQDYWLNIMPAKYMHSIHIVGFAKGGEAFISEDLPIRVKKFVISHEIYHLNDKRIWLGYFGKELRANTVCGFKNPLGLLSTITHGIKNHRLSFYFKSLIAKS